MRIEKQVKTSILKIRLNAYKNKALIRSEVMEDNGRLTWIRLLLRLDILLKALPVTSMGTYLEGYSWEMTCMRSSGDMRPYSGFCWASES